MASSYLILTFSAAATAVIHFHLHHGPDIDYVSAPADIVISGRMMHHPLLDGAAPCHCMSSGFLADAPTIHLSAMGGRIF